MTRLLCWIFGVKKRQSIRKAKLYETTTLFGIPILCRRIEPPKADPVTKHKAMEVDKMRVHVLKPLDNVTNLTKRTDVV